MHKWRFRLQSLSFIYTKANESYPMHGEVIFRIKGTVSVHDKFIVFLDSKFETRSSIIETRDSILKSFKNQELSLDASDFKQYCS